MNSDTVEAFLYRWLDGKGSSGTARRHGATVEKFLAHLGKKSQAAMRQPSRHRAEREKLKELATPQRASLRPRKIPAPARLGVVLPGRESAVPSRRPASPCGRSAMSRGRPAVASGRAAVAPVVVAAARDAQQRAEHCDGMLPGQLLDVRVAVAHVSLSPSSILLSPKVPLAPRVPCRLSSACADAGRTT